MAEETRRRPRKSKKAAAAPGTGLNVAFVLRMFSRNFAYNESIRGGQQGYQAPEKRFNNLPLVPAPGLALEYFPAKFAGVFGSFNYGIAGSKDQGGSVYKTSVYSWMIGGKGRIGLGSMDIEPSVGYGSNVFKVDDFATGANGIQVAAVDYRHIRAGGGVSLPVSFGRFQAGGHYLHILSAGDILSDKYFQGNAVGGEVFAGAIIPLELHEEPGLPSEPGLPPDRLRLHPRRPDGHPPGRRRRRPVHRPEPRHRLQRSAAASQRRC